MTTVEQGFDTRAIHAGQAPDPQTGAVVPPIYQTSTFIQDDVNVLRAGHEYSRGSNPTRNGFEEQLAALEGGTRAFAFASGIAAEDALLRAVLRPGDHVVIGSDSYGGTNRLLRDVLGPWGITHTAVDAGNLDAVRAAIRPDATAVLWVETPSNPHLGLADLAGWAAVASEAGCLLFVDNTFASPALQRPLDWGADAVVHSTTKYIGGHSDVLGGAVVVGETQFQGSPLAEAVAFQQFAAGAVAGPQDCFLAARGLKTLGLRVRQHSANALAVARWLEPQLGVAQVFYPGLESHPGHRIAARQMHGGFGGVVSLRLAGGEAAARRFVTATRLFGLSVSLGGVESLICLPTDMTHGPLRGTPREIGADIVRLSVGIEDVSDVIGDLEQALDVVAAEALGAPVQRSGARVVARRAGSLPTQRVLPTAAPALARK